MTRKSNVSELGAERAGREELAARIALLLPHDGRIEVAPGVILVRFSSPTGPLYGVDAPSFCVIAQGRKEVFLGEDCFPYDPTQYLLLTSGLPVVSHVVEASRERPYLALRLVLQPSMVAKVLMENATESRPETGALKAVAVGPLVQELLDPVLRLMRLAEAPTEFAALAPLAIHEIIYRLARSGQSARLRQMIQVQGQAHRMLRAIQFVQEHHSEPLRMSALARQFGMSVSSFHHQFKAVSSMSPLQFQKEVRLQTARQLLVNSDLDAAMVGYRVGYRDQSQFNREYKRLFGEPPARDKHRLGAATRRTAATVG